MYKTIRLSGLIVLFLLTVFINSASSAEFTVMQGWLMDEDCLEAKKVTCPLKEYTGNNLVLLTPDEQTYRLKSNGVEDWKLQKAYGQLIGLKGLRDGNIIKVTNIVQVTGAGKLRKA
ncbi:MAG: hypothetical protein ABFR82_13415 [Nitrospirota bacterium]